MEGDEEKGMASSSTSQSLGEEKLRNESERCGTENTPPSIPLCQHRAVEAKRRERKTKTQRRRPSK